jgi:hypothetical protein
VEGGSEEEAFVLSFLFCFVFGGGRGRVRGAFLFFFFFFPPLLLFFSIEDATSYLASALCSVLAEARDQVHVALSKKQRTRFRKCLVVLYFGAEAVPALILLVGPGLQLARAQKKTLFPSPSS